MGVQATSPDQIRQRLFNPQQNPLYPNPAPPQPGAPPDFPGAVLPNPDNRQPQLDTAPPPPTKLSDGASFSHPNAGAPPMDTSNPPINQMGQPAMREVGTAEPQRGAVSAGMKPVLGEKDFAAQNPDASTAFMAARPVGDFDTGKHPKLRSTLASLFAGLAEFGRPGAGQAFVNRWADQNQQQHTYDATEPKMRAGALHQAYQQYLQQNEERQKISHDRYLAPRSGGVFDTESGNYATGAEPTEKPEAPHTVETAAGVFQWNPDTKRYDIPIGASKPKTQSFDEQAYEEWHQAHPKGTRIDYKRATEKPDKPERPPHQMIIGPDGTAIDIKPGDKVPAGSKTASEYGKPSADEQRRADLAGNLNENLDKLEDIVSRRPELFGPLAGRWAELKGKFGSNDPDIAALQVLEHQIGMAQISAHGMRSAHGIEGAAQSIINGLHSGPAAMKSAIGTVRDSVRTFQQDVATAKGQPAAQSAGKASGVGQQPKGATHRAKGSDGKWHYTNAQGQDLGVAP